MKKKKKVRVKNKINKGEKATIKFPRKILKPVSDFLTFNLKKLEKRKNEIDSEDPFKNSERAADNASPDADAEEQFGHARTSALKNQLDRKIVQTKKALSRVKRGSYGICEDCSEIIDTDRLIIYPEATFCSKCQTKREA